MLCNQCNVKRCKDRVKQTRSGVFVCPDHVPIRGGWELWEVARGDWATLVHNYNIKLRGISNGSTTASKHE